MQIHFVLVEPSVPENVGASARAINTMGFKSLRLVNPCNHLDERALWLAYGSAEILKRAVVFTDLATALEDMEFVIGTTAKRREVKYDYYPCNQLADIIARKKSAITQVAIVFGREDNGLSNKELKLCDIVSTVPMSNTYPSLNLSQAVMVFAYCLSPLTLRKMPAQKKTKDLNQFSVLKHTVKELMHRLEIDKCPTFGNRLLERLGALELGDIRLLHSVCNRVLDKIRN
jgi:tRNA/rRNA methyltransferase